MTHFRMEKPVLERCNRRCIVASQHTENAT